jgi:hypothetical protein
LKVASRPRVTLRKGARSRSRSLSLQEEVGFELPMEILDCRHIASAPTRALSRFAHEPRSISTVRCRRCRRRTPRASAGSDAPDGDDRSFTDVMKSCPSGASWQRRSSTTGHFRGGLESRLAEHRRRTSRLCPTAPGPEENNQIMLSSICTPIRFCSLVNNRSIDMLIT